MDSQIIIAISILLGSPGHLGLFPSRNDLQKIIPIYQSHLSLVYHIHSYDQLSILLYKSLYQPKYKFPILVVCLAESVHHIHLHLPIDIFLFHVYGLL